MKKRAYFSMLLDGVVSMSMVDVSGKPEVFREAVATGEIKLKPETLKLIKEGRVEKGDVFTLAKVAGIQAAKRTSEIIPLCHPLPLSGIDVDLKLVDGSKVTVKATIRATAKTGVEMEALVAASTALLTVWDLTKQYEKDDSGQYPTTVIENIRVLKKVKRK